MLGFCKNGMLETLHLILANCTIIISRETVCPFFFTLHVPYSLKTSKVTYLDEAFQFYSAIKNRGYYKMADKYASDNYLFRCMLDSFACYSKEKMVKKLRFYSRFIVVCLLLDKKSKIQESIQVSVLVTTIATF